MKVYVLCIETRHNSGWDYEAVFASKEAAENYLVDAVKVWHKDTFYRRWESDWIGDSTYSYRWLIFEEEIAE